MKIDYRTPQATADVSASRGSDGPEFVKLTLLTVVVIGAIYLGVGALVDWGVTRISVARELALFVDIDFSDLDSDDSEALATARSLLDRLSDSPQVPDIPFRLILMDEADPNAFAFPGGTIGVTRGLLDLLPEEQDLAFVLAHELGHFQNRDHLRGLGRALGINLLVGVIFGAQMEVGSVATVPMMMMTSSYSRAQETRADEYALRLMLDVFGTDTGFERLFTELEQQSDLPAWTQMFSTHPLPGDRILNLRRLADLLRSEGSGSE